MRPAPRSFVSDVGPESRGLGPAGARREHRDWGVIGEDRLSFQNVPADRGGQGLEQRRGLPDPVRQGRSVEVDAVAVIDLALPVEGKMIGELADEDMRQEARSGTAALDRARRQWRLDEPLAPRARQARSHDPVHDEPSGDILQLLGDVLAEPAERAAAARAALLAGGELDLHARHVIRDRPPLRLVLLLDVRKPKPGRHRRGGDLAALEGELQLLRRLRGRTEPVGSVTGELVAELLDQDRLRLHLGQKPRREGPEVFGIVRQRCGIVQHGRSLSGGDP